jgi:hypothetical protein
MPLLLGASVFGGVISGLIGLFLFGLLVRVSGRWLGGTGTAGRLRTAIAWACVPSVVSLALWIPEYWIFGRELFSADTPIMDERPFTLVGFAVLQIVLGVWGLVILTKGVAQIHGFSAWRSLSAMIVAVLLIVLPVLALAIGIASLT